MVDFQKEVIEKSYSTPVVVDFWAPWCGPCRVLGPAIEQLADEQAGRWELVKLNTQDQPDIAQEYRIMSIPNVKLFREGREVAEFVGALPKSGIEAWLDEHIPSSEKEALKDILQKEVMYPDEEVKRQLDALVVSMPQFQDAKVALARQIVLSDPKKAIELVTDIPMGHEWHETASDIRELAQFMETSWPAESEGVASLLGKAREALAARQLEPAIQALIDAVTINKNYQNDLPRKLAIAVFRLLGQQHPLNKNYRWRFDMALY
jgi:putative thioredoxin